MAKRIYHFEAGSADGDQSMSSLLGGKGANLAEMSRIGIPVPPGFTVTTEVCADFHKNGEKLMPDDEKAIHEGIASIEKAIDRKFGDDEDPLLVSVRSGAAVSMPGMMDTILNLGLNKQAVRGLAKVTGDERFAWDTYRRFIQMFAEIVLGLDANEFETILDRAKKANGVSQDAELQPKSLEDIAEEYLALVQEKTSRPFPDDPKEQLMEAVKAVLRSWNTPRAQAYRRINKIAGNLFTAATVQAMVFGNRGESSGTGVLFTRNPSTGEEGLFGEFLINAQGEDVVAGIRTPMAINRRSSNSNASSSSMEEKWPSVYGKLEGTAKRLEEHFKDMQDIEFTVDEGQLWLLQTRNGKRTAHAALKIAVDMVEKKVINRSEALMKMRPADFVQLLHPSFDPKAERNVIASGLAASPGAVSGSVVFSAEKAEAQAANGNRVLLVRPETSPEDIGGMHAAEGILTSRGGMTSHAAVVARGMGKCCIAGCGSITVDLEKKLFTTDSGATVKEGDILSLDGTTGEVVLGDLPRVPPSRGKDYETFMSWVDDVRLLAVRVNADTPGDCETARQFGAEGVGLCRTEHMFFDKERIDLVRQMILSDRKEERQSFLAQLEGVQEKDFEGIFRVMEGLPVTIRLLDPPLHEFLPRTEQEIAEFAERIGEDLKTIRTRVEKLGEVNPMLGHRGCRLAITYPEIYEMQVRAILRAATRVEKENRKPIMPEIMIPLVSEPKEFEILRKRTEEVGQEILKQAGSELKFLIGTMIELPRAALMANQIATSADFFSFGTNDLTQTTFGLSRDDSGRFLPSYVEKNILEEDPFQTIDDEGVLELVIIGVERGRATKPDLKIGICGEHGGDPASIAHFCRIGMNYVSCSPFRVPVARLALAQEAIRNRSQDV